MSEDDKTVYRCVQCGAVVHVDDNGVHRTCSCPGTTGVTADISGHVIGSVYFN